MESDCVLVGASSSGSRKRQSMATKREIQKTKRYQIPKFTNKFVSTCKHQAKVYCCDKVTQQEIDFCRQKIYEETNGNKVLQDQQLCHYIGVTSPLRKRPRFENPGKNHEIAVCYMIPSGKNGSNRVCQKFFLKAFKISKFRMNRLATILQEGGIPKEKRGGDRVSHKIKVGKDEVREFLRNLKGNESHYGRSKSKRIYLNCNVTISKLYQHYKNSNKDNVIEKVSYSTFQRIFAKEFNIGFNTPASDICSLCERLKNSIAREKDPVKKSKLITEQKVHKLRANAFYKLMKSNDEPNTLSYCFDMQQVQPLPKTPVSDAFYLRQVGYYTLCIVGLDSRNPNFYTWTEDEAGRGATEVASALFNFLNELELPENITNLRLFSDGCGGQNKNSHVVHTLMYWLYKTRSCINNIAFIFPVRGHSFLPADRAFGRIEKILRKEAFIKTKEQYHELYEQVGRVKVIGKGWKVFDIKELENVYKKVGGIQEMKRILLSKTVKNEKVVVTMKGVSNYNFETNDTVPSQTLIKRGRNVSSIKLKELKLNRSLPQKKIDNVKALLTAEFGADWEVEPDLQWYRTLVFGDSIANDDSENEQANTNCCCLDEEDILQI